MNSHTSVIVSSDYCNKDVMMSIRTSICMLFWWYSMYGDVPVGVEYLEYIGLSNRAGYNPV